MSDKSTNVAKAVPNAQEKAKKKGGLKGVILGVIIAMGAVAILPTTLIIVVGMVPTAVAYFVDNSRDRTLGPTVCFLNFAGVLPALLRLWEENHIIDSAIYILSKPTVILIMLLPAALGWLLYAYTPIFIGGILRRKAELRIKSLEKEQEKLIANWGLLVKSGNSAPIQLGDESSDITSDTNDKPINDVL
jgi:hypothetical protein